MSAEQQEADWEQWVDFYADARQANADDSTQIEQAKRDAYGMKTAGRQDGLYAAYEVAISDGTLSQAKTAAKDAARARYSETLQGVYNHWTSRLTQVQEMMQLVNSSDFATSVNEVAETYAAGGGYSGYDGPHDAWTAFNSSWGTQSGTTVSSDLMPVITSLTNSDVTLPDGQTVTVPGGTEVKTSSYDNETSYFGAALSIDLGANAVHNYRNPPNGNADQAWFHTDVRIREPDPTLYDSVDSSEVDTSDFDGHKPIMNTRDFHALVAEIERMMQDTLSTLDSMVEAKFDGMKSGDVSLQDLVGSQAMWEAARNAENFREAALAFRSAGYYTADTPTVVEFERQDGTTVEVDAHLAVARTTDLDPLPVGSQVDASNIAGTVYMAYNEEDADGNVTGGAITSITGAFTIVAAEDGSSEVAFTRRGVIETSMSPTEIRKILEENGDAKADAEEARQDINVEGSSLFGGGIDLGGGNSLLWSLLAGLGSLGVAAVAFVIAWFVASD
ncbi:hypothetical protein L593_13685 [Salinarchaeum sp. Harcht-Bsk1]|uniref:hypothetical protein n=1 Tax=Salinarchaeum sp. Harcht-Bsk1 TaxID=1333523 RepID=UPI00034232F4|nr:hypothetical protein [Salinarchaeum sp. Harcht-Bsk1]AGN02676.1 hypothetical protein L593_13685 [Salinarchaeum sp. Harcht-Bsk1]